MSDRVGPCHHGKIGTKRVCVWWIFRRLGDCGIRDEGNADRTGKNTKEWNDCGMKIRTRCCRLATRQWGCRKAKWERAEIGHMTMGAGRIMSQDLVKGEPGD